MLGRPAGTEDPATETGIDPHGGDGADATSDGGPDVPDGVEPDLKDAASGPRQVDVGSVRREGAAARVGAFEPLLFTRRSTCRSKRLRASAGQNASR